ncbi:MAG: response regulator [Desulfobacterales bacterium]|jgi:DNA-binding response OmpR family regulator|nr:response regulator [Desulfobacterales bacterium]
MSEKVLIVDDEKDFLDIIAERIGARGMDVSTASSAEAALNMVEEESYDVVIMDFMMPALDGFKALKLMKAKRPEVQIILLTGNVPDEKRMEARELGALDVIEKPPDLQDLIKKIKKAKKAQRTVHGKKGRHKK